MDRQPLTDRLGDRLLAEYGGAAAAYSLRALNGNGDSVVRVRRASDNDEKDFTAEQIELGEMVNWVNSQTVPPLDIGVETSEGRIPVPEGGTSIGTPAAAYSLRNLSTTYTGNVVDVRRSSDNTVASFTASQISNGQMLDFVGGDNTIIQSEDFTSGSWNKSSGRVVITSNSITAPDGELTADLATWSTPNNADSLRQDKSFLAQQYTVSIYLKYNSAQWVQMYFGSTGFTGGHANFDLINGVIGGNKVGSSSIEDVGDGWYRCSVTRTASTSGNTAICATVPVSSGLASRFGAEVAGAYYVWGGQMNEGSIKAYTMTTTGVSGNGFVSKWYDQSGNDNHATQGTAASQPKIVDAGSLVSGGLEFDGVNDYLEQTLTLTQPVSIFSAYKAISNNSPITGSALSSMAVARRASGEYIMFSGTALAAGVHPSTEVLASCIFDGATSTGHWNGVAILSGDVGSLSDLDFIGRNATGLMHGTIQEIIIYDSDQSANRTAIEANIGETYGITGIPAYDNTVDGFVETWYDQSGNGNDAVQATANDQPRIVISGNLVTSSNGLPAIRVNAQAESFDLDSNIALGNFSLFYTVEHTAFGSAVSWLSNNSGSTYMRYTPIAYNVDTGAIDNGYINLDATLATATNYLISAIRGSGIIELSVSGSVQSNTDSNAGILSVQKMFQRGSNETQGLNGYAQELIIYPTDKTANRVAIETNINDHYNIY
jgi:hypothetical protein